MFPTPCSSNYWIFACAWSYCVILCLKRKAKAWGVKNCFHSECTKQIYLWGNRITVNLQVCQMDFLSSGSCWLGALQSAGSLSLIKSTVLLLMLWGSFKLRWVPVPAPVGKSSVRILQQGETYWSLRVTMKTETQSWKTTQQKASPRTSLSVYAALHSISLSEDAAPSLSCKAPTEMDQEDKIWRYRNTGVYVTLK